VQLILSLSISPLFNKISWLCGQQPREDEASNEGCNSGPTGHDLTDNSNMFLLNDQVHEEFCNQVYRFASVGQLLETRTYPQQLYSLVYMNVVRVSNLQC
jgi:hypothetical protein